jgi:hypothetical protein
VARGRANSDAVQVAGRIATRLAAFSIRPVALRLPAGIEAIQLALPKTRIVKKGHTMTTQALIAPGHSTPDPLARIARGFAAALLAVVALGGLATAPLAAQDLETFDPDQAFSDAPATTSGAIDADLAAPPADPAPTRLPETLPPTLPAQNQDFEEGFADYADPSVPRDEAEGGQWVDPSSGASVGSEAGSATAPETVAGTQNTYAEDDLIGAAEGVFGKGAEGLARLIEDLLKKEGRPNGYIVGREAGGAFIVGARYGSGTLHHKVEGTRKVYWTGPSVGFDAGANAANTFVLVYNLFDSEDLFKRYPAGEGQAYLIGGLHASYMRRGDVVLIPIRMGAGLRLGVNAGYMKFSKKQRWLPF